MMRRTLSISILFLSMTGAVNAQNLGEIRGKVLDPLGDPLPFAHVHTTVAGEVFGTTTGEDGKFILKPLPPGMYSVNVSYVGYEPADLAGIAVTADRASYIDDIHMRFIGALDTFEVVGNRYQRPLIEKEDPSRMSLLAEEFKNDPNKRDPVKLLGNNFAGVTPAPNGDGLYFRGARTENMISFIDGVKVQGAVPRIPPSAISSISVYTGGLPAKYGDVTGGVVVIETMTYAEMYEQAKLKRLMEEQ